MKHNHTLTSSTANSWQGCRQGALVALEVGSDQAHASRDDDADTDTVDEPEGDEYGPDGVDKGRRN